MIYEYTEYTILSILYSHDPCLWACGRTVGDTCRGFVALLHRMWARSWVGGGAAQVWSSWPKLDNRISQLISDHLTGLYHNYFVIISSVILCLNFERRLLTSVHHFKPSRFLSKLPRSFQEMTVNPSLPSNCLADCPLPSRAVTRHRWWKSPAGAGEPWQEGCSDQPLWDSVHFAGTPGIALAIFAML